jgi:transcription-repair coupling factor (superfamily II helicase)
VSLSVTLASIPHSAHGYLAAKLAQSSGKPVIHICANDRQMEEAVQLAQYFAPKLNILSLPAWDCLPYDRVSPAPSITAARLATLSTLAIHASHPGLEPGSRNKTPDSSNELAGSGNVLLFTTIGAAMQKLPPKAALAQASFQIQQGQKLQHDDLIHYLVQHGYSRVSKVMEPGEFAVRGNIIDLFAAGHTDAIRLDLFGDEVETLKTFDPLSQISSGTVKHIHLHPMNEILFNDESIERFRTGYRERFGAMNKSDPLYEAISSGRHYAGMEHWLPLFYEDCDSLFEYLPEAVLSVDEAVHPIFTDRAELLQDYYKARLETPKQADSPTYHPLESEALYLLESDWKDALALRDVQAYTSLTAANADNTHGVRACPSYAAKVGEPPETPFVSLKGRTDKPIQIAAYSAGSAERIKQMADDAGVTGLKISILPIEHGFDCREFLLVSEQDLLGERVIRTEKRKRQSEAFLVDAQILSEGELIVHKEHGIGRFEGLTTVEAAGAKYDCLKLIYADDAKLFLPVVNMELISRFGSDAEGVQLDKLGAANWQKRKAAMKERIKLAAEALLKIAARRATRTAATLEPVAHSYAEFCARFPYSETEDQQRAIDDTLADIAGGKPMDRLICGDVGFGKTEVALRAAFVAVSGTNKVQVAIIAPTTLLARQHYINFKQRFDGFGVTVKLLSRLVSGKEQAISKEGLKSGDVDIVVGTHALLSKQIEFAKLGMVVVDEEQRFGVAQKERLKHLRANIHVLTLSATPIPRTLQMALAGVRELSLITTAPVDRLAVRSFVMPFDSHVIKEAILREFHRGGKVFYVTPRVQYIDELQQKIKALVPDIRIAVAHGQMPATALEDVMNDFYDGKYDLLLATTIIESGLDVPSANTIIIDHAELFGLAQLYQLRGRVGRGKVRAYAYLTLPPKKTLTGTAYKRLEVMSQLDTLGAGFTLASHDMDIRGFGNLLGEEQSGHVREVGVELYQHMLEEAIERLKAGDDSDDLEFSKDDWSPSINLGSSVLIPDHYVEALDIRMQLYRRLAGLQSDAEIESFAAELIDRFGPLPAEVTQLIKVLHLKRLCKQAGIERIDTGPKGAVFSFRSNAFAKPEALLRYITQQPKRYKIRADQKLVFMGSWRSPQQQFDEINAAAESIAQLITA